MSDNHRPPGRPAACPICRRPAQTAFRPFCSARCADIDLGRWFTEGYRIPAGSPGLEDEDAPESDKAG